MAAGPSGTSPGGDVLSIPQEAALGLRMLRARNQEARRPAGPHRGGASPDQTPITPFWAIGRKSEPLNPVGEVVFMREAAHDSVERRYERSDGVS